VSGERPGAERPYLEAAGFGLTSVGVLVELAVCLGSNPLRLVRSHARARIPCLRTSVWRQHAGRSRWTIRSIFEGILFSCRLANARRTHHERSYVYDPGWSGLIGSPVSAALPAAAVGAFLVVASVTRGGGLCLSRSLRKTKQFLR
jgi:hypothetical protein